MRNFIKLIKAVFLTSVILLAISSCGEKSGNADVSKVNDAEYVPTTNTQMFWLLRDKQIEDHSLLEAEILDMKQAGFKEILVMLRATRYHLFDDEVKGASKKIGELCEKHNMRYVLGLDPPARNGQPDLSVCCL